MKINNIIPSSTIPLVLQVVSTRQFTYYVMVIPALICIMVFQIQLMKLSLPLNPPRSRTQNHRIVTTTTNPSIHEEEIIPFILPTKITTTATTSTSTSNTTNISIAINDNDNTNINRISISTAKIKIINDTVRNELRHSNTNTNNTENNNNTNRDVLRNAIAQATNNGKLLQFLQTTKERIRKDQPQNSTSKLKNHQQTNNRLQKQVKNQQLQQQQIRLSTKEIRPKNDSTKIVTTTVQNSLNENDNIHIVFSTGCSQSQDCT
jgi:hypothetical protein